MESLSLGDTSIAPRHHVKNARLNGNSGRRKGCVGGRLTWSRGIPELRYTLLIGLQHFRLFFVFFWNCERQRRASIVVKSPPSSPFLYLSSIDAFSFCVWLKIHSMGHCVNCHSVNVQVPIIRRLWFLDRLWGFFFFFVDRRKEDGEATPNGGKKWVITCSVEWKGIH